MATTLVNSPELLLDVIRAFAVQCPAARLLGGEFVKQGLKYNKTYTPHVASLPIAEDVTSTYAVTGNNARSLLTDITITINKRKGVRLYWENLYAIQDDKFQYDKIVRSAGAELAKAFMLDIAAEMTALNFSQESVYTTANSDSDMLDEVCTNMNVLGAATTGRVMVVNSSVAATLNADSRVASKDYQGRLQGGNALRSWQGMNGFDLIQEWPSLPSNNGTALTSVTTDATGGTYEDMFSKTSHGLVTGQRVRAYGFSAGTGLTGANLAAATTYYVIRKSANEFQLATTLANAYAGTAFDVSADGTGGTIAPANNLTAFASDGTAIQFMAGPEDHSDQMAMMNSMGITNVMDFDSLTDPDTGISMSLVKQQDANTGNIWWMPVLIWGKRAGRNAETTIGALTDYGGYRIASA